MGSYTIMCLKLTAPVAWGHIEREGGSWDTEIEMVLAWNHFHSGVDYVLQGGDCP